LPPRPKHFHTHSPNSTHAPVDSPARLLSHTPRRCTAAAATHACHRSQVSNLKIRASLRSSLVAATDSVPFLSAACWWPCPLLCAGLGLPATSRGRSAAAPPIPYAGLNTPDLATAPSVAMDLPYPPGKWRWRSTMVVGS